MHDVGKCWCHAHTTTTTSTSVSTTHPSLPLGVVWKRARRRSTSCANACQASWHGLRVSLVAESSNSQAPSSGKGLRPRDKCRTSIRGRWPGSSSSLPTPVSSCAHLLPDQLPLLHDEQTHTPTPHRTGAPTIRPRHRRVMSRCSAVHATPHTAQLPTFETMQCAALHQMCAASCLSRNLQYDSDWHCPPLTGSKASL